MAVASSASKTAFEDMESPLACPVCLDLPSGEVHQCLEGHCMCVDCWNRLDPRRCPECRDWLPHKNRNRDREARIAAMDAACDHCGMTTTRGAIAEHLRACHLRPTTCAAAEAGCGWKGMAAEQAAHESACSLVFVNGLFAQQPLAGRVRAFEGDEEGGRRRQRVLGPVVHDAPPSDATVAVMGMAEATAALRKHLMVARVAEKACKQLRLLSKGMMKGFGELPESLAGFRSLCVSGLDAVVEVMRAHPQVAKVQEEGCGALQSLTIRIGPESATEAGTVEAALDAMRAHLQVTHVLLRGFKALFWPSYGCAAAVQRVAEAGGLQLVVAAMRTHPQVAEVQERGVQALFSWRGLLCRAPYGHRVTEVGGQDVLAAAMQAFPANQDHQRFCAARLLDILAASSSASSASAAQCS